MRRRFLPLGYVLGVLVLLFSGQHEGLAYKLDVEKRVLIDKLLEQSGQSPLDVGRDFSKALIKQFTDYVNERDPEIEPRAFTILEDEVQKLVYAEVIVGSRLKSVIYPIYDKYFTVSDLRAIVEFNETPAGRKRIKVMPLVLAESIQAGRSLGQFLSPKITERFKARLDEAGIAYTFD